MLINNDNIQKPIKIRVARAQVGLSCREAAAKLGISRQLYYNYERGEHLPNVLTALKIAEIYNIPVDALAWGEQNKL